MTKPTHASVTEEPCTCGYLQNSHDDPLNPITFDAETAEYQFAYGRHVWVIYHCPFCGGAAPKSKRGLLFAQIPDSEAERLASVLDGIETIDQAVSKFGPPNMDGALKAVRPEKENQAPSVQYHREIRYFGLSELADVSITERQDGKIFWQLQGKHLGRQAGKTVPKRNHRPWWRFW